MNKCLKCGKNCENEYCFMHKPKKKLSCKLVSNKEMQVLKQEESLKMKEFFLKIWKERPHCSEVSGEKLLGEANSTYFHHILLKSIVPEAKFDEENIILLSSTEHANCHSDMYRYEEINKRREQLLIKYNKL